VKSRRLIITLGLAGFIVMADNWVVSPLLPTIARSFGVDPVRTGILIAAYMLPFGLFQLVYGPLADRFGKLKVISITLGLFTIATTLCGFGLGLADLTAYRALTGIFAAATMPVGLALIGDLVPMNGRQHAIATFMGIAFLGQAASMTIGGAIAYVSSWRGVFWIYGVAAALITVLVLVSTRGARSELKGDPNSEFIKPYGRLLRQGPSLRTYLVTLIEGVLILGSFSYLGTEAAHSLGLGNLGIGLLMAVFGLGVIVGSRTSGPLSNRIGRHLLVSIGIVSAAVADFLVAFVSKQTAVSAVALFLLGVGFMLAHSSLLTTATQFAHRARGTAMSLVAFCFMVGGSLGTLLGGRVIGAMGFGDFYTIFGAALVALGLIAFFAVPKQLHTAAGEQRQVLDETGSSQASIGGPAVETTGPAPAQRVVETAQG
jgi:predicted MFS family arabinose efflux permease